MMIDLATGETRRPRVLVVEEDRGFALALLFALEPHADVCLVASGGAARARLGAGERYDAVVCDRDELRDQVPAGHPLLLARADRGSADLAAARLLAALGA